MFVQLSLSFRLKRLLQGSTSTFIFANVLCDLQRIYFPGISKQTRPHAKTYCKVRSHYEHLLLEAIAAAFFVAKHSDLFYASLRAQKRKMPFP